MLFLTLALQIQSTTQGDNITLAAAANCFGVNIIVVCPGQAKHEIPCQRKGKKIMDEWVLLHRPEKFEGHDYGHYDTIHSHCRAKRRTAQFAPPPQAPQRSSKRKTKQRGSPAPVRLLDQDVIEIDSSSDEDDASSVSEEQVEKVSPTDLYLSLVLYFLNTGDVSTECC